MKEDRLARINRHRKAQELKTAVNRRNVAVARKTANRKNVAMARRTQLDVRNCKNAVLEVPTIVWIDATKTDHWCVNGRHRPVSGSRNSDSDDEDEDEDESTDVSSENGSEISSCILSVKSGGGLEHETDSTGTASNDDGSIRDETDHELNASEPSSDESGESEQSAGESASDGSDAVQSGYSDRDALAVDFDAHAEFGGILERVRCENCCRRGDGVVLDVGTVPGDEYKAYNCLHVLSVPCGSIKNRRRMCHLSAADLHRIGEEVMLCWQCYNCVCRDNATSKAFLYGWPSFIRSWLSSKVWTPSTALSRCWRVVPTKYRVWWIAFIRTKPVFNACGVRQPKALLSDVSVSMNNFADAWKGLKAMELFRCFDKFAALPLVRCPWGCSEFLNRCNKLPLDTMMLHSAFGHDITDVVTGQTRGSCDYLRGVRQNCLTACFPVLMNRNWQCRPRVCFDVNEGPMVLTCRFHSRKSKGRYLHIPVSPIGSLSSMHDNQLAIAVAKPRGVRKSKRRTYTDSYQLTVANGQYDGIDTMILSTQGRFEGCSVLSNLRDAITLRMRNDVRTFWTSGAGHLPPDCVRVLLDFAEREIPTAFCNHLAQTGGRGTYVTMEDAIQLQTTLRDETLQTVELDSGGSIQCSLPWTRDVLYVHDGNHYGSAFPSLPHMPKNHVADFRTLWIPVTLLCSCVKLWSLVSDRVKREGEWYGWAMAYSARSCYPWMVNTGRSKKDSCPFAQKKNSTDLLKLVKDTAGIQEDYYRGLQLRLLFQDVAGVGVYDWRDVCQESFDWNVISTSSDVKVVIVLNSVDDMTTQSTSTDLWEEKPEWELRVLVSTEALAGCGNFGGTVYARHGHTSQSQWWLRRHVPSNKLTIRQPVKVKPESNLLREIGNQWDVALYVRSSTTSYADHQLKYMQCSGFQTFVRCRTHKKLLFFPLQIKADTACPECSSCGKKPYVCCLEEGCTVGLCLQHFCALQQKHQNNKTNNILYVAPEDVERSVDEETDSTISQGSSSTEPSSVCISIHRRDEGEQAGCFSDDSSSDGESDLHLHESDDEVDSMNREQEVINMSTDDTHTDEQEDWQEEMGRTIQDCALYTRGVKRSVPIMSEETITFHNQSGVWDMGCHNPDDTDEVPETSESEFFTTHAGLPVHEFDCAPRFVGSHVLFNKFGTLLVRQKRKLKPSRLQQKWLQKIICQSGDNLQTVPLVYFEATLFPSIFYRSISDGSVIGALPSALLADNYTLRRQGIASLHDHVRTRITDPSLICSTDSHYQLTMFDCCLNLGCRGQDTRIHMRRGFDPKLLEGEGIKCRNGDDPSSQAMFDSEEVDSRIVCNKLAAAIHQKAATLFVTFTLNQKEHFGTRILKSYLDSDEALDDIINHFVASNRVSLNDREAIRQDVLDSSSNLAMRVWDNTWFVFRHYLMHSQELPLGGTVVDLFDRMENQTKAGAANLPHHHLIVWLKEDDGSPEARLKIVQNIRASIMSMVNEDEYRKWHEQGVIRSYDHYVELMEKMATFLEHKHDQRCLVPRYGDGVGVNEASCTTDGDLTVDELMRQGYRCKVPDNHKISVCPSEHTFRKIQRPHCNLAKDVFFELGLLQRVTNELGVLEEVLDDRLVAVTHIPPTTAEHGIMSPVLARLALLNPANGNAQFLDSILAARYLTKYVVMLDESNRIWMKPSSNAGSNSIHVHAQNIPNTKIAAVKRDLDEKTKSGKVKFVARIVGHPEVTNTLLNGEPIYLTQTFLHISTAPFGERSGFDTKQKRFTLVNQGAISQVPPRPTDLDASRVVLSHSVRCRWAVDERHYTANALIQAKDLCFSPITPDTVTIFGLRPPELYWVRHQKVYFEFFTRERIVVKPIDGESKFDAHYRYCKENIEREFRDCAWIDGLFYRVKLRRAALHGILEYLESLSDSDVKHMKNNQQKSEIQFVLNSLHQGYTKWRTRSFRNERAESRWIRSKDLFLGDLDDDKLPIVYYSNIKPSLGHRFLTHLLLSMGKFTNEMDLTLSGSIRSAFVTAELLNLSDPLHSAKRLLRRYLLEQMPAHCCGTQRYDQTLLQAKEVIMMTFIHDRTTALNGMPPVLYTRTVALAEEKERTFLRKQRKDCAAFLITQLRECGIPHLPSALSVTNMTLEEARNPVWSSSSVSRTDVQSGASFEEQQRVLEAGRQSVKDLIFHNHQMHPKNLCVVGGPGNGKTAVSFMLLLHAMSHGLNVFATALMSERASELGGMHLHRLICLPGDCDLTSSAVRAAEKAIANLYSYGMLHLCLIRKIDVLLIDELGQWPSLLIATVDIVLRRVRRSDLFFGGVLVYSTYDIYQLLPIRAIPPLLSGHMLSCFEFLELIQSVRASADPLLQEFQQLLRIVNSAFDHSHRARFIELFTTIFTFVDSFDDPTIPSDAMYVFGKKEPGRRLRDRILEKYRNDPTVLRRAADDQESTLNSNWKPASDSSKRYLDTRCKEDRELYFVKGMIYESTQVRRNCYNNHQLCLLWDLPSRDALDNFKPIKVLVAPSGKKDSPQINPTMTKQSFLNAGWTEQSMTVCRDRVYTKKGAITVRRKQYGLKLRVTSTIHGSMGSTYSSMVTKIEDSPDSPYSYWERAQIVVVTSRTKFAKDVYFVGEPLPTARAVLRILTQRSQYFDYMLSVLNALLRNERPVAQFSEHPFRPMEIELPNDCSGFCYMVVSLRESEVTYIGETSNLGRRIDQHNSGNTSGAQQTRSFHLRPWALMGFVCGFDYDVSARKSFEKQWQCCRDRLRRTQHRNPTPQETMQLAHNVIQSRRVLHPLESLRVVIAGTVPDQ